MSCRRIETKKTESLMAFAKRLIRRAYDDRIDELQELIDANQEDCRQLRWFQIDVLKHALRRRQFKAYAVLKVNGFKLPFENKGYTQRFDKLTEAEMTELRSEVRKSYIPSNDFVEGQKDVSPIVKKLLLKSKLASLRLESTRFFIKLKERYEELEKMEDIRPILIIIADAERLEIVHEFNELRVAYTLPGDPYVTGLTDYENRLILVVASFYPDEASAILVHEFFHYVMSVLYMNQAFPFRWGDVERGEEFSKAYEDCEATIKSDEYKDLKSAEIFNYQQEGESPKLLEGIRRTEAITLPATIPIRYRTEDAVNQRELKRSKECLAPLYEFYKTYTFPEIVKKSEEIEAKWEAQGNYVSLRQFDESD